MYFVISQIFDFYIFIIFKHDKTQIYMNDVVLWHLIYCSIHYLFKTFFSSTQYLARVAKKLGKIPVLAGFTKEKG